MSSTNFISMEIFCRISSRVIYGQIPKKSATSEIKNASGRNATLIAKSMDKVFSLSLMERLTRESVLLRSDIRAMLKKQFGTTCHGTSYQNLTIQLSSRSWRQTKISKTTLNTIKKPARKPYHSQARLSAQTMSSLSAPRLIWVWQAQQCSVNCPSRSVPLSTRKWLTRNIRARQIFCRLNTLIGTPSGTSKCADPGTKARKKSQTRTR